MGLMLHITFNLLAHQGEGMGILALHVNVSGSNHTLDLQNSTGIMT